MCPDSTTHEIWKPIPGYEDLYEVSNLGRVKTLGRVDARGAKWPRRILKGWVNSLGYPQVELRKNGQRQVAHVHRLVALAFLGEPPQDVDVHHRNGLRTDNCLENLEYMVHSEHISNAVRSESHPTRTLTRDDVHAIRALLQTNMLSTRQIADQYGISRTTVNKIRNRQSWGWLE